MYIVFKPYMPCPNQMSTIMTMNHSYRFIKPMISSSSFGHAFHGPLIGILKQYHTIPANNLHEETEPFSMIRSWVRKSYVFDSWRLTQHSSKVLGPGMVHLKKYISHKGQVDIVNICEKCGLGPGGFYEPRDQSGAKLQRHMMCFGLNWDPITKYEKRFRSDGSKAPPLPYQLLSLAETIIDEINLYSFIPTLVPLMRPDFCLANFYSPGYGQLGLHQDQDESSYSVREGLPVVSVSIGDSAEFVYGHTRDENKLYKVLLESGDVLVFGGESRLIFHGVKQVFPGTTPPPLLQETGLRPGRLNLTFKQVKED